jgi:hypothetical protein
VEHIGFIGEIMSKNQNREKLEAATHKTATLPHLLIKRTYIQASIGVVVTTCGICGSFSGKGREK